MNETLLDTFLISGIPQPLSRIVIITLFSEVIFPFM